MRALHGEVHLAFDNHIRQYNSGKGFAIEPISKTECSFTGSLPFKTSRHFFLHHIYQFVNLLQPGHNLLFDGPFIHKIHNNTQHNISTQSNRPLYWGATHSIDKQKQIDHVKNQGGLAYIAHPHWGNYDENFLSQFENFDGIAVFNSLTYGVAVWQGREEEVLPYNERVIDALLGKGRYVAIMSEEDTKYEDPHKYGHQLNTAWMNVWGDVPPSEITVPEILKAIREKRFTSHGRHLRTYPEPPRFVKISTGEMSVNVEIDKASDITFITKGGTIKKIVRNTKLASCVISPDDGYLRVKATFTASESSWAWTNPIYVERL